MFALWPLKVKSGGLLDIVLLGAASSPRQGCSGAMRRELQPCHTKPRYIDPASNADQGPGLQPTGGRLAAGRCIQSRYGLPRRLVAPASSLNPCGCRNFRFASQGRADANIGCYHTQRRKRSLQSDELDARCWSHDAVAENYGVCGEQRRLLSSSRSARNQLLLPRFDSSTKSRSARVLARCAEMSPMITRCK